MCAEGCFFCLLYFFFVVTFLVNDEYTKIIIIHKVKKNLQNILRYYKLNEQFGAKESSKEMICCWAFYCRVIIFLVFLVALIKLQSLSTVFCYGHSEKKF